MSTRVASEGTRDRLRRVLAARVAGVRPTSLVLLVAVVVTAIGATLPWIHGETKYNGFLHWTGFDDWADGMLLIVLSLFYVAYVRFRSLLLDIEHRARWLPLAVAAISTGVWWIAFERASSLVYVGPPDGARVQVGLYVELVAVVIGLVGAALVTVEDHRPQPKMPVRPNPDAVPTQRVR